MECETVLMVLALLAWSICRGWCNEILIGVLGCCSCTILCSNRAELGGAIAMDTC